MMGRNVEKAVRDYLRRKESEAAAKDQAREDERREAIDKVDGGSDPE